MMEYQIGPLESSHDRSDFDCGIQSLNDYLKKQVNQDIRKSLSVCFTLTNSEKVVKGYFTLSSTSISRDNLPVNIVKKIPRSYIDLPATLLGRLAIDKKEQGKKYGELLLIDELKRTYGISKNRIGSMAIIVDPINESAIKFYSNYGFILLPDSGKMFLAMKTIEKLF